MPTELGFEVTHSTSSWLIGACLYDDCASLFLPTVGSIGGDMAVPALMGLFITWKSHSLAWAVLVASIVLLGICGIFVVFAQRWTNAPRCVASCALTISNAYLLRRNAEEELAVLTKDVAEPTFAP